MAKGKKRKAAAGDVATNRYASYRFELLERIECGLVLAGTEVKSLRNGTVQIKDGYAQVRDGELWLHNVHIPPYGPASRENHDPDRPRKLLAHRREIKKLEGETSVKGTTLIPLAIYFKNGRAKVEIGVARGKHQHDKRDAIRKKEMDRELRRAMSHRR